ncbi:glycosyltransferase family 2 protein [Microcystis aeruginosa]|uniref:Probable glycosyl transferase n=1 Tax=Microcystis aeruginosa (strain NIES-843 / IAM M-2473) TaxID=449447 RepID=B0JJ61_MICAN|nr:glycosyltransferase family 2 protein [Microcystis aeruginosa]BAG05769.1 probable glycosyl transferase [Microcystis aeruginosa NIES-843]
MLENQVRADAASNEQIPTLELSIIMPCLNEAETLATCIGKARDYLEQHKIAGEVLIADNGSSDGSQEIATNSGARVVPIPERGYGSALRGGIAAAKGQYIIMGDADDSYDFTNLSPFLEKLRQGYDLVMGNRFQGGIKPGAMPVLHKYLGNPVLTWLGRLFFGSPCGDFHCGLRGFSKQAIEQLNLRTTGMEFASEMVVKASLYGLKITEVPTTLSPDGRSRPPHLKTWRDGWRHLRFLLMYSPRWLFLYPGLALMFLGLIATIWFMTQPRVHTLLYSATALIIGFQIVSFAIFTKAFAISEGLLPEDRKLRRFLRYINLEVGLIIGVILLVLGMGGSLYALYIWNARLYGALDPAVTMRIVIPSVTALALGVQVVFSSFFLSVLQLKRK